MRYNDVGEDLRPLIFDFFFWFSRFESALKESGWLQSKAIGAAARPGWPDFIKAYSADYTLSESASQLLDSKPQKQIIGDAGLAFTEVTFKNDATQLERVAVLLKTVRNNLFHGGKHGSDYWDNPGRMQLLLQLSVTVLAELASHGDLEADYTGYY